jgi:hypothetical protein
MFDEIYKDLYSVVVVANKRDMYILSNFNDPINYFKSFFGENTIIIQIPEIADIANPKETNLFMKNKVLLHVESSNGSIKGNDNNWLFFMDLTQ